MNDSYFVKQIRCELFVANLILIKKKEMIKFARFYEQFYMSGKLRGQGYH